MVSKAAKRSSKTKIDSHWPSIARCMSLTKQISAVSGLWHFLETNCILALWPLSWRYLSIWKATILLSVFDRNDTIENRPVVTKPVGVKSFFLDKRTDNRLLEIRRKKVFQGKFIMVVMGGRRKSMQFFRSQVGSGSKEQDLGFAERVIFLSSYRKYA